MERSTTADNLCAVIINSLGSATLSSASAVAKGLGITTAQVVNCLYRAPAVLVDQIEHSLASHLTKILIEIGYDASLCPQQDIDIPSQPPLYDVAIYLKHPERFSTAVDKLSQFIGLSPEDASRAVLTPPGLVLGSISKATVDSFTAFIGDTLDIIAAPQNDANYYLFLGECPEIVKSRLFTDLESQKITILARDGLIAADVNTQTMESLWSRHKTNSALKAINSNFLRYDIILLPPQTTFCVAAKTHLANLTGIPAQYIDDIVKSAPVTIIESLEATKLEPLLTAFAEHNILVRAELINFQMLGLRIAQSSNIHQLNQLLAQFSLSHECKSTPCELPFRFPEIQARLIKSVLENAEHQVEFIHE